MENLPHYVYLLFGFTSLLAIGLFYKATRYSKSFLVWISLWSLFQIILSLSGFYQNANSIPPRFMLLLLPPLLLLLFLFNSAKGKVFIDSLDIKALTIFSIIRIPIEIVLYLLFTYKTIPGLMTFEGRNFDIFSGISAAVIYYLAFVNKKISNSVLLTWNFVCVALLLNVVVQALLAIPSVIQQFAFEQPNIAVNYFPFVLLPSVLVPLALSSHLASIRQLLKLKQG
jgi:hypothetical protein